MIDCFINLWENKDVFVIGGGPSINDVSGIDRLENANVIGVNDAYNFGEAVVDILFFGDKRWWDAHEEDLIGWSAPIVTNNEKLEWEDGVIFLPRKRKGFHKDALGWNGNSGSSAINLALITGARHVYLLGFDMKHDKDGWANWHDESVKPAVPENYINYRRDICSSQWEHNFPNAQIINLNPDSALECFPKIDAESVLGEI